MPGQNYGEIATRLRKAGLAGHTPCAIVSRATAQHQQTRLTTVRELPGAPQLPSPTLLIVGEIVRFAQHSGWQPGSLPSDQLRDIDFDSLLAQVARLTRGGSLEPEA
jgi:hypothetical protein